MADDWLAKRDPDEQPPPDPAGPPSPVPPPADAGAPGYGAAPGHGPPAGPPYGYGAYPPVNNDSTVLILGILGLVFCPVLAPIAWWKGREQLEETRRMGYPDPSNVKAGYVLGIVGTVFVVGVMALYAVVIVIAIVASNV